MRKSLTVKRRSLIAGLLLAIAALLPAVAADLNVPTQYPTIQAAVNAATNGDTIHIAPGVYVQQVTITNKSLTLAGAPGTVIRAGKGMTTAHFPPVPEWEWFSLVSAFSADVAIRDLTFEGEHLADSYPQSGLLGILFAGSSGRVEHCTVHGFGGTNLTSPDSFGILVGNPVSHGTPVVNVQVRNSAFADNRYSIELFGDFLDRDRALRRVTFEIADNIITGIGPSATISQEGIRISTGAGGEVRGNTIADLSYTGGGLAHVSAGVNAGNSYPFEPGVTGIPLQPLRIESNTFRNNQIDLLALRCDGGQFINNTFVGPGAGYRSTGLITSGQDAQIVSNSFSNLPAGILLVGDDPEFGTILGVTTNATLIGNRFCDVTTPIDIEPLVTGTTNQGTLVCPFPDPELVIAPAVLLTWPGYTEGWVLESAATVNGPWTSADATPVLQGDQNTATVRTDSQHQFFRLHKP